MYKVNGELSSCDINIFWQSSIQREQHTQLCIITSLKWIIQICSNFLVGFVKLLSTHPVHILVWGNFRFKRWYLNSCRLVARDCIGARNSIFTKVMVSTILHQPCHLFIPLCLGLLLWGGGDTDMIQFWLQSQKHSLSNCIVTKETSPLLCYNMGMCPITLGQVRVKIYKHFWNKNRCQNIGQAIDTFAKCELIIKCCSWKSWSNFLYFLFYFWLCCCFFMCKICTCF